MGSMFLSRKISTTNSGEYKNKILIVEKVELAK